MLFSSTVRPEKKRSFTSSAACGRTPAPETTLTVSVAASDCELVPIDERYFRFLVGQTPFFALTVMRAMAARLRRASAPAAPAPAQATTAAAD